MPRTHRGSRRSATTSRTGSAAPKAIAALVVFAGLAGGGYWVWGGTSTQGAAEARRAATADSAVATTMDFDIETLANGELAAKNQVEIRSQLDTMSTVVEIVAEGTRVKKGDQLVKLNGDQLQQQIDTQKPLVESAKSDVVSAENEVKNQEDENASALRKAELKVTLAKLALEQWEKGEVEKTRTQNDQAIRRAERDLDRLKDKVKQSDELFAKGFLSSDEKELDHIALEEAETKVTTAKLDHETFEQYQYPRDRQQKESDVTEAQAELERTKRSNEIQLTSKKALCEAKQANLKLLSDRLAKLESQLAMCVVLAPTEGLVVYGSSLNSDFMWDSRGAMRIGREVAPNDLMIVLPDTSEMVSTVRVHESLAGRIKPGLPASMKIEAVGNAVFSGKVESIGVLAESNGWRDPNRREYTVKLVMDPGQDGEKLKPSMRCEATIQLGKVQQALAVPLQAVFNDGPVRYVYIPKGGKYVKQPVNIGQRSDAYAEITAGLEAGKRVLVRQPTPAEVLDTPWDPEQLKVCGLKLNDKGEPVPLNPGGGRGRPGGRGPATEVAGGPPGAPAQPAQAAGAPEPGDTVAAAPAEAPVGPDVPKDEASKTADAAASDSDKSDSAKTETAAAPAEAAKPADKSTTAPASGGGQ